MGGTGRPVKHSQMGIGKSHVLQILSMFLLLNFNCNPCQHFCEHCFICFILAHCRTESCPVSEGFPCDSQEDCKGSRLLCQKHKIVRWGVTPDWKKCTEPGLYSLYYS